MPHKDIIPRMEPTLIEDNQSLIEFCDKLINEPLLAIDTEFFRETTYYPHLGLIQIGSPDDIICVDPLAFDAREQLSRIFFNPEITKIFHSCSQDMEVLNLYFDKLPGPVFDTQIAAAMLGYQDQIGYANLVAEQFNIKLDKSQTRTNWLKRPLTTNQIKYAGEDVLYLLPLYTKFNQSLKELERDQWLQEDCEEICGNSGRFQPDVNNSWQRVKGYFKLNGIQLAICSSIAQWREQLAIKKDLTRRRIMSDDLILELSVTIADSSSLNITNKYLSRFSKEEQETLTQAINKGLQSPESDWPIINRNRPTNEEKAQLKKLQTLVKNKATELNISQGLLCSKKELEKLIKGEQQGKILTGWRLECIGKHLLAEIEQKV